MLTRIIGRGVLALGLAAVGAAPVAAQSVGAISAVNQSATGLPPGAALRPLVIGLPIVARERIQTNESGTAQIVFTDQSTMNIGRGSTIVVDRFVYDPAARTGQQAVSLTRGLLRFVGGQVSHGAGMSLRTPVATVGVRGGIGTVGFVPGCGMLVLNQYGSLAVANRAGSTTIRRPGYHVCIASSDAPIGQPRPIPPELLARVMALLTSASGQSGGTLQPFDESVARTLGLGNTRPSDRPGPPQGTPGLDQLAAPRGGNAVVQSGAQGASGGDPTSGCTSIFCN